MRVAVRGGMPSPNVTGRYQHLFTGTIAVWLYLGGVRPFVTYILTFIKQINVRSTACPRCNTWSRSPRSLDSLLPQAASRTNGLGGRRDEAQSGSPYRTEETTSALFTARDKTGTGIVTMTKVKWPMKLNESVLLSAHEGDFRDGGLRIAGGEQQAPQAAEHAHCRSTAVL